MGLPRFDRQFFGGKAPVTRIGAGEIGGKAGGLLAAQELLGTRVDQAGFPGVTLDVPRLAVVATDVFDAFLAGNRLGELARSGAPDHVIAHAFQRGELPADVVGDLWALVRQVKQPLAVRSSSLLEDQLRHPFAGVYTTKMTPNHQFDPETRFRRLVEAIKLVWASTFFGEARAYLARVGCDDRDEKMAVVIQEVVGRRHAQRFYPDVSGVARSFDFYPAPGARREDGAVSLALGLGKTIVDGARCWTYSPARPAAAPPYGRVDELFDATQSEFWAVNMGPAVAYDPTTEVEYLVKGTLAEAEEDGTLRLTASTYDARSERLVVGTAPPGARLVNFAPLLAQAALPVNAAVRAVLAACEEASGSAVEVEFALSIDRDTARFGFLQVRPMAVSTQPVEIAEAELCGARALVASRSVVGNGVVEGIRDVVYVRPEAFELRHSQAIAAAIAERNRALAESRRHYVLVGFGRWGSQDPWLGIPVLWSQISEARVIVELEAPKGRIEPSQGAHFFHNLTSFEIPYFSVPSGSAGRIDWAALERLATVSETPFVRHVETPLPLEVKVDGRTGRGVILLREDA